MAVKDSVRAIEMASFDTAELEPAAWQAITPAGGLPHSCFFISIKNMSNRTVTVSYDETNIHDIVPTMAGQLIDNNSILDLDFQSNSSPNNQTALLPKGTVISLRGAVDGTGLIYLSGYYQEEMA